MDSIKKLYSFYWDCGRMGDLQGLFVATEEEVAKAIGQHVSFGECLGKHSDTYGTLEAEHLTIVSEDQDKVLWFEEIVGSTGHCPLDYIYCDDCGENVVDCDCEPEEDEQ